MRLCKSSKGSPGAKSNEVREWVYKKADWYDPLVEVEDNLLEESYRAKLNKILKI